MKKINKLTAGITLINKKFKKGEYYHYFEEPNNVIIIPKIKNYFVLVKQKREPINKKRFFTTHAREAKPVNCQVGLTVRTPSGCAGRALRTPPSSPTAPTPACDRTTGTRGSSRGKRGREKRGGKSRCGSGVENKDRGRNHAHTYSSITIVSSKAEMLADTEARV